LVYSVALSDDGNRLAVSALNNDNNFSNAGQVKLFEVVTTVAVTEELQLDIKVFPNPTRETLQVSGIIKGDLKVVDPFGRVLYQTKVQDELTSIDLHHLPSGVYFLQIRSGGQGLSKRVIKN
jgi:hypothetical protein